MYCLTIKPIGFFKHGKTRNYIFSSVQRLQAFLELACSGNHDPFPSLPPTACPGRPRTNWPHPLLRYSLLPPSSQQQKSQIALPPLGSLILAVWSGRPSRKILPGSDTPEGSSDQVTRKPRPGLNTEATRPRELEMVRPHPIRAFNWYRPPKCKDKKLNY